MMPIEDETLRTYIKETLENLAYVKQDLLTILTIEDMADDINEEIISNVLKVTLAIKGGAGLMGLKNIKQLSNKLENALSLIRDRQMDIIPEVINTLLEGFDKLNELIDNVEKSDEIDIAENIVALTGLTSAFLPYREKRTVMEMIDICHPDGRSLFSISDFELNRAIRGKKNIYLVEFDLIHDAHYENKTPLDIVKDIQSIGNILECAIDIQSVGTLEEEKIINRLPFLILISSKIFPDSIEKNLGISKKYIHLIINKKNIVSLRDHLEEENKL